MSWRYNPASDDDNARWTEKLTHHPFACRRIQASSAREDIMKSITPSRYGGIK